MSGPPGAADLPLAVDLDGTLVKTDVLFESLAAALTRAPWLFLAAPFVLLFGGRPLLKRMAARHAPIDPATLPYREDVLAWIAAEAARGREIVLATAAAAAPAAAIAGHLGLFARVFASEGRTNLKGARKAAVLAAAYPAGFAYAGDSRADLAVWARAGALTLVDCSASVTAAAHALGKPVERVFARAGGQARAWLAALRPAHWLKNLLVFLAIPAAHLFVEPRAWAMAAAGFAILSLIASAGYVLNDLADLGADRAHAEKRARPFAAGALPLAAGLLAAPAGLALGIWLAALLDPGFAQLAALYAVLTIAYSLGVKRLAFVDVLLLGGLFTLRVVMGAVLIGVAVSPFLFLLSAFLFTSLALAKRVAELVAKARAGAEDAPGRGYAVADLPLVRAAGWFCTACAVLLLVLYVSDPTPMAAFGAPGWLWSWPLMLLAWLVRISLLAAAGALDEDPLLFALRDPLSWAFAAGLALTYAAAAP